MPIDEIKKVAWGVLFGALFSALCCWMHVAVKPDDHNVCSAYCEAAGHSEHAFDLQRGCVCSDPWVWVRP